MQLRSLALLTLALDALLAGATRVHHRPVRFKTKQHLVHAVGGARRRALEPRARGMIQMAYFTNWGIYGRNFQPTDIDATTLTHVLYSFADVSPDTGELKLSDTYADTDKHYPGDSWSETGNNLYGCFKQLYLLKLKNRNLKVLLSVGGWTYSQSGHFNFVTDAGKRAAFVASAVKAVENYALDGIDIDFEYPTAAQKSSYTALMAALRSALDALQAQKGDAQPYLLSAALPAGASNAANFDVPALVPLLDLFNLMTYDFAGSWSTVTGDLANLYENGLASEDANADGAVNWWTSRGAPDAKVVMGLPLYGRGFESTAGLGKPFSGIGPGTWEAGVYDYSVLPFAGATVFENTSSVSSYSYDSSKKELISYDTPAIATLKAQYVMRNGLGGAMYWELSGDRKGTGNLVRTVGSTFGSLAQSQNHIAYPGSMYDNVRSFMGLGPGNTTIPTTTVTGTTASSTSTSSTTSRSTVSSTSRSTSTSSSTRASTVSSSTTSRSSTSSSTTTPRSTSSSTTTRSTSTSSSSTTTRSTTSSTTSRSTSAGPTSTGVVTVTVTVTAGCSAQPTATTSAGGACAGLSAYSASAAYTGGQAASYNGHKWTAQWWTQGEAPSTGGSGVWRDDGAC